MPATGLPLLGRNHRRLPSASSSNNSAAGIGGAAGDRGGREREDEASRIGKHVAGIGDEREGACEVAGDGLDGDEEEREKEAQEESPAGAVVGGVHATMVTGQEAGNPARC